LLQNTIHIPLPLPPRSQASSVDRRSSPVMRSKTLPSLLSLSLSLLRAFLVRRKGKLPSSFHSFSGCLWPLSLDACGPHQPGALLTEGKFPSDDSSTKSTLRFKRNKIVVSIQ
jgi:hypothetical protein